MNFITPLAVCLAVCALATRARAQSYHGILINGYYGGGTQIYDPFNTPHAQGNLTLGLQKSYFASGGAAVINGQMAYFCGNGGFECCLLRILSYA
jgi:hypothetical protein